jgi:hypothetical protein
VINGVYEVLGDTVRIITDSKRTASEVQALIDDLRQAKNRRASNEEIQRTIEEKAPELTGLLSFLRQREGREEVYKVLGIIIALLGLLLAYLKVNQSPPPVQINSLVERAVAEAVAPPVEPQPPNRKQRRAQGSKARHK